MVQKNFDDLKLLAMALAARCVRNTSLEDIHAGKCPVTRTGDFSDVRIIDADGNDFSWNEASHISNDEMKILMKQVVNKLYESFIRADDPLYTRELEYAIRFTRNWDEPEYPTKKPK